MIKANLTSNPTFGMGAYSQGAISPHQKACFVPFDGFANLVMDSGNLQNSKIPFSVIGFYVVNVKQNKNNCKKSQTNENLMKRSFQAKCRFQVFFLSKYVMANFSKKVLESHLESILLPDTITGLFSP